MCDYILQVKKSINLIQAKKAISRAQLLKASPKSVLFFY